MKWFVCGGILLFSLFRINDWKQKSDVTDAICGSVSTNPLSNDRSARMRVRGRGNTAYDGGSEIRNPEVFFENKWVSTLFTLSGLNLSSELPENTGVEVYGVFHCSHSLKNFSEREDSLFGKRPLRLVFKKGKMILCPIPFSPSAFFRIGTKLRTYIKTSLILYPHLKGIVWAVWTGETVGLDPRLVELYRRGGLLALIALSGQHVSVFVLMIRLLFRLIPSWIVEQKWFRRHYRQWLLGAPVIGSLVLTLTSYGAPSVLRTLALALAFYLFRLNQKFCTSIQLLCSSSALLILMEPNLINKASFILSLGGTYLLFELSQCGKLKKSIQNYFLFTIAVSLVSVPMILFYFGECSYWAPVGVIAIGWLWNLVIIPLGFLIPLFAVFLNTKSSSVLSLLNAGWQFLVEKQLWVEKIIEKSHRVYLRPNVLETCVVQIGLLLFLKWFLMRFKTSNAVRLI